MLHGTFGVEDGSLQLDGTLILPELQLQLPIRLLVDTGATNTCVHPEALEDLGVKVQAITQLPKSEIAGIGGSITVYEAQGFLAFQDGDTVHLYQRPFSIFDPEDPPDVPSILGRDVLERWRMVYARAQGVLEFDVLDSDYTWSVSL